ncbi:MAG: AglZ/HisF2 family acetamidino modification protein [Bacteroidota bacterium]
MKRVRVIPVLQLSKNKLVKTKCFKKPVYIGDPINTLRIFNEKQVDEIILLDIDASKNNQEPNYSLISQIAGECFMPVAYGGGITSVQQAKRIINSGIEKISINNSIFSNPELIKQLADEIGSQSLIASIDVKKTILGKYKVYCHVKGIQNIDPVEFAQRLEFLGVGEILLTAVDREGTFEGYDIRLVNSIATSINIPLITNGGASCIKDFYDVYVNGKASAVAAGSMFVFKSSINGILINYPEQNLLKNELYCKI